MTKTIKRTIVVFGAVMICIAVLLAAGCTPDSYEKPKKDAQLSTPDLITAGKLKVGVDAGNNPLAGKHGDQIVGIDADVAAAIAEELGLEVELTDIGTAAETSLNNKKVDVVLGASKSTTSNKL